MGKIKGERKILHIWIYTRCFLLYCIALGLILITHLRCSFLRRGETKSTSSLSYLSHREGYIHCLLFYHHHHQMALNKPPLRINQTFNDKIFSLFIRLSFELLAIFHCFSVVDYRGKWIRWRRSPKDACNVIGFLNYHALFYS